ncbi:MAG: 23S rRNA (adenine(2503)-C(2))-methyltransferase RlmN [Polyangiaceae bacterium]|nr:23S rRNA (adenine(2503)-C(2))-methyltransferase RlmN [Polyangiaceae bacterium]
MLALVRTQKRTSSKPADDLFSSHDAASLTAWLVERGETSTAAKATVMKVIRHVHTSRGEVPWSDEALAALGINKNARQKLLALSPRVSLEVASRAPSNDGSMRLLLRTRDGALIESVLIPGPARTTLCVSSQVGCARACSFCETGSHGLTRQLSAGEIVDQVRIALVEHAARGGEPPLVNLVFMGMGEPFDNLTEVLRAISLLTDGRAYDFAPARITVSTVGVADKIQAFFAGTRARLAVSLNAPDDERRSRMMPVNQRFNLEDLKKALLQYMPRTRGVLFEYVLFHGVNDSPEDAARLAEYVADIPCRVNVIPCNPGPDPTLLPPEDEAITRFLHELMSRGVTTLVRRPRGRDVGGACGQLAGAARRVLPLVG